MTSVEWFLGVGAFLFSLGGVRLLTASDHIIRLVALNIAGGGGLLVLVALAARTDTADPVPQALALTGIVITVAVTGVGLALVRRLDDAGDDPEPHDPDARPDAPGATLQERDR